MGGVIQSKLYTGLVAHARLKPFAHKFRYKIFMTYIDLDELDSLLRESPLFSRKRAALVQFKRSDYLGDPGIPLTDAVRDRVENETGKRPDGPVRMLTHLRTFGYVFNPVTFYYCFDKEDRKVETIVAEITNTPWKQRRAYILTPSMNLSKEAGKYHYRFDKDFHVSPFFDLDFAYDMQFSEPGDNLFVQIENKRDDDRHFIATLNMAPQDYTAKNLAKNLVMFPFMTFKVFWAIYWQALKLKLKGATYYPNPHSKAGQNFENDSVGLNQVTSTG